MLERPERDSHSFEELHRLLPADPAPAHQAQLTRPGTANEKEAIEIAALALAIVRRRVPPITCLELDLPDHEFVRRGITRPADSDGQRTRERQPEHRPASREVEPIATPIHAAGLEQRLARTPLEAAERA